MAYVNVQKQISPALNSVTVLACATETNISRTLQKNVKRILENCKYLLNSDG